ncbi:putative peptidase DUF31 [Mycoplasma testudineum]|uniref:Putative peptidase DUF31 n=1 Tax=Mycoplasma testudineum TaxID=244584 RepID=A0A4R6IJA8_9MOLU|nr:hypothetical protein [Mycoplasma testudineum]OYD26424.1 hypothetical protein CG473_04015 [Mycoplasma testudineum]TDO22099.1 putative peptidase DUF31 [Mycoplasma testudineum]
MKRKILFVSIGTLSTMTISVSAIACGNTFEKEPILELPTPVLGGGNGNVITPTPGDGEETSPKPGDGNETSPKPGQGEEIKKPENGAGSGNEQKEPDQNGSSKVTDNNPNNDPKNEENPKPSNPDDKKVDALPETNNYKYQLKADFGTQKLSTSFSDAGTPNDPDVKNKSVNNQTINSQAQRLDKIEALKLIHDRTFSIRISTTSDGKSYLSTPQQRGTAWLLDYHKKSENSYTLFFASNIHVLESIHNTAATGLDFDYNVKNPNQEVNIAFGKVKQELQYNPLNEDGNGYRVNGGNGFGEVAYVTNKKYDNSSFQSTYGSYFQGMSSPKLIFAAADFMSDETTNQFSTIFKDRASNKNILDNDSQKEEKINQLINQNKFGFMKDFAVFAVDIDLNNTNFEALTNSVWGNDFKSNQEGIEFTKKWFKNAMASVDKSIELSKKKIPNTNGELAYMNQDVVSAAFDNGTHTDNQLVNASSQIKNINILGYPVRNGIARPIYNNYQYSGFKPIAENENVIDLVNKDGIDSGIQAVSIDNISLEWFMGKFWFDYYGYQFRLKHASIGGGGSGSLVTSDFGLPIGIYFGATQTMHGDDQSGIGLVEPFSQSQDMYINFSGGQAILHSYNLIDKTKHKFQKNSYRSNLKSIMDKNGQTVYKTALFPEGV